MTDLVDGKPLVLAQPAAGVECLLLEEEADLVAGLLEVAVASVHLLARREDAGDARGIEARHQLFGARHEGVAVGRLHHALEHQRSEEHTSELQSLMRISYAVSCLKKKHTRAARSTALA